MTRKEFNLAKERRKAGLTQVELGIISEGGRSTIQYHERNGIPNKLAEYGYKKIFEEIANKC